MKLNTLVRKLLRREEVGIDNSWAARSQKCFNGRRRRPEGVRINKLILRGGPGEAAYAKVSPLPIEIGHMDASQIQSLVMKT